MMTGKDKGEFLDTFSEEIYSMWRFQIIFVSCNYLELISEVSKLSLLVIVGIQN